MRKLKKYTTRKVFREFTVKTKPPFWGILYLSGVWNQNGGGTYSGYFSRQAYVQPYHSKVLGESFPLVWLNIGLSWNIREQCVPWLFFKIDLCSAISFKRSQRDLSIDVAEHRSTSTNYQNTHCPRFSFIPKTGIASPKTGVCFYCEVFRIVVTN